MLHAAVAPSLPASGVTHSVAGRFSDGLPNGVQELFVFKKNNVELWRVPPAVEAGMRLSYVTSVQLNAPPVAVAACRPLGFAVDVIAMCFDDFHVSFVMYDPLLMRLHTLALVQLNDREVAHEVTPLEPLMRADPTGHFIAVLARRRHMFLIPLLGVKRPGGDEDDDGDNNNSNGAALMTGQQLKNNTDMAATTDDWGDEDEYEEKAPNDKNEAQAEEQIGIDAQSQPHDSKIIDVSKELLRIGTISMFTLATAVKGSIRYVRDIQFIDSTGEPIVAVLCERQPTWAGRVKLVEWRTKTVESDILSSQVVWVQISSASTSTPKLLLIGEVDDIPYNVTHMTPVGSFAQTPSGVLCYGINTVIHVTTKRGYGVYFNNNGMEESANSKSSAMSFKKASWCDPELEASTELFRVNLCLANCAAATMSAGKESLQVLAVSEADGVVVTLHFAAQGSTVQDIKLSILGTGCYCSSIAPINGRAAFLGSASGDSCVAAVDPLHNDATMRFRILESMEAIGCIMDIDAVDCRGVADGEVGQSNTPKDSWLDGMPYAELLRSTVLEPIPRVPITECRAAMDLAVCAGRGGSGSLFVLRQSVRGNVVHRESVNAVSAFFLDALENSKRPRIEDEKDDGAPRVSLRAPPHLLLTGLSFTILFTVRGGSVQHVRRSEFLASCRTVFAADIPWLNALLQVTEREGRIISSDGRSLLLRFHFVPEREVDRHRIVKSACISAESQLLFVLMEDGTLLQFKLNSAQIAPQKEVLAESVAAFALWRDQRRVVAFSRDGTMTITDIETRSVFAVFPRLGMLPPHSVISTAEASGEGLPHSSSHDTVDAVSVVEHLEVVTMPEDSAAPASAATSLLIVLATGELAVYQLLGPDAFGPLRLVKSLHHFLDNKAEREVIESIEAKRQRMQRERIIENDTQLMRHCSRRIVSFNVISGHAGAYVCGQHPLFLFWDRRQRQLVGYRHQAPGAVRGFVPFPSIGNGFLYCCEGFVDFASMNEYCRPSGHGWLSRRIHLGVTPHFVVYHPPAHSCFVVTSRKEPFRPQRASFDLQLKINYDEEFGNIQSVTTVAPVCNMPPIKSDAGMPVPMNDRFEIRFMSTADWRCTDTFPLEENEQVLAAQLMEIHYNKDKDADGPQTAPVCVVSTAFPLGEDVTCRGRILLLASKWVKGVRKILTLHSEPLNGPATAVTGIRNHIAVAVGGTIKLFRYDWESRKLVVGALLYAGIYVTRMSAFRNYLIYGDLHRSCALARFNEENHTLMVLGKDRNAVSIVHCDMMYHDRAFGILSSDDQRNLLLMGYTPRLQEMEVGKPNKVLESVLSLDGEYRLPSGCMVKSLRFRSLAGNSSVAIYVTNYGEIGFVVPIGEQANRTALWMSRRLQMELQHEAGLVPRMFLGLSQESPRTALRAKEMLVSAPLLKQFFFLDVCTRKAIASAAYTHLDRVTNVAALIYEECSLF
ncbi:putative cleavage and polyadenylation specificity factor [Trypanosoma grayi]|uniref:putative cleavage and polyadenylation specificity factor n=1 Tax=Trypanosoma grayi TaxID=71804 RepID=UPI0004F4B9B9|nr:putative cleavage and polyadenylation specificity factor [Trypanosoma grayi]KEG10976.1 putative cleavage and polyadenylation specificity factor [Trypanosoma grayi]